MFQLYETEGLKACMKKANMATEWVNYGYKQNLTLLHTTNFMAQ